RRPRFHPIPRTSSARTGRRPRRFGLPRFPAPPSLDALQPIARALRTPALHIRTRLDRQRYRVFVRHLRAAVAATEEGGFVVHAASGIVSAIAAICSADRPLQYLSATC